MSHISHDNNGFLQDLFGVDWQRVLVVSFAEDPENAPEACWAAHSVGALIRRGQWPLRVERNNYFCVSLFHGEHRRKAAFEALCVFALDDVGDTGGGNPKIRVDTGWALDRLGVPSWAVETSPGNQQWFYALQPWVTDLAKAEALMGLVKNDAQGVTRLMRLPGGTNTKGSLR